MSSRCSKGRLHVAVFPASAGTKWGGARLEDHSRESAHLEQSFVATLPLLEIKTSSYRRGRFDQGLTNFINGIRRLAGLVVDFQGCRSRSRSQRLSSR